MVFVTVGNATQGFLRLLEGADHAAGTGVFGDETVLMQTGNTKGFKTSHCQQERFIEMGRFEEMLRTASLIISHAGAGTLLQVLRAGKVPIVMPRLKRYGEHVDDHQVELVQALAKEGRLIPAFEPDDLPRAVREARRRKNQAQVNQPPRILELVAAAIKELSNERLAE